MKGVISPRLRKILNDPELRVKFFKEYFGVEFVNPPKHRPKIKEPELKKGTRTKKRNFLDIILGK
jgi:hypothetical protein